MPQYAGLNYEHIWLDGMPPYSGKDGSPFEPRCEPMRVEEADEGHVVLVQPETSHSHVSACITFTVEEPHYLHQHIELTCHQRFCEEGRPNRFRSLWASYIHMPPDRHVYARTDWRSGNDLASWFGITKESHAAEHYQVRLLPDDRELSAAQHLEAMLSQDFLSDEELSSLPQDVWPAHALPRATDAPLSFYYGLCHGPQLFLMMFRQADRFRLAYSPSGGGREPVWSPAWDYVLHVDDARPGETYLWDVCLVVKQYQGRADVLEEVRQYLNA